MLIYIHNAINLYSKVKDTLNLRAGHTSYTISVLFVKGELIHISTLNKKETVEHSVKFFFETEFEYETYIEDLFINLFHALTENIEGDVFFLEFNKPAKGHINFSIIDGEGNEVLCSSFKMLQKLL